MKCFQGTLSDSTSITVSELVNSNYEANLNILETPIAGSFTRISDDPLFEWHGFATVPEPGKKCYSLVVSRAGDWTAKQIDNPPTQLRVRASRTARNPNFRSTPYVPSIHSCSSTEKEGNVNEDSSFSQDSEHVISTLNELFKQHIEGTSGRPSSGGRRPH